MGDATESLLPAPNYNTPVKDLEYKDLLTNRGLSKLGVSRQLTLSVFIVANGIGMKGSM